MKTEGYRPCGLYHPSFEHDACGIGAVVDIKGRQSHQTVDDALKIVEKLEHRAGKDAEGKTGDGVGILLQISHRFFSKAAQEAGLRPARGAGLRRGHVLLPPGHPASAARPRRCSRSWCEKEGMEFLGWRTVPGAARRSWASKALDKMPCIEQGFVTQAGRDRARPGF